MKRLFDSTVLVIIGSAFIISQLYPIPSRQMIMIGIGIILVLKGFLILLDCKNNNCSN